LGRGAATRLFPFQPETKIMQLRCGSHILDLSSPVVMGILNVTPASTLCA
jgi:hypothetical protein